LFEGRRDVVGVYHATGLEYRGVAAAFVTPLMDGRNALLLYGYEAEQRGRANCKSRNERVKTYKLLIV